jgi:hypothetical protein
MKKYSVWIYIIGISIGIAMIAIKCESMIKNTSNSESDSNLEVNVKNASEVQSYLQGKWQMAYYPQAGLTIHVRFLIEGNTIKTWSSVNDHNTDRDFKWDMNKQPDEVYTFKIGDLNDSGDVRDIEWDNNGDLTLQQRAIGEIYVNSELGFCNNGRGVADIFDKGWK